MKHFIIKLPTFAVIISGILFFISCSEKETDLNVNPHHLVFNAEDLSEKSFAIETNAKYWDFEINSLNWLDVYTKPNVKNKLFVRVHNNADTEGSRVGHITVSAGKSAMIDVTVEQLKKETNKLSVSLDNIIFYTSDTGDKHIEITTDAPGWDATSNASWLQLRKQGHTLIVSVSATSSQVVPLVAEITITAGNALPVIITVTQGGANYLLVSPAALTFSSYELSSQTVTVTTNAPGWHASCDVVWITLANNNNLLTVTASPNVTATPRYATITVTGGSQVRTILVTQSSPEYLSINPTSIAFSATETSSKAVTVTTNALIWNATASDSWLHIGKSANILTITPLSNNTSTSTRSAVVVVTAGSATPVTLLVTQAAGVAAVSINGRANYRATGVQLNENREFNSTWTGEIIPDYLASIPHISITNWSGNWGPTIFCNYVGGKYRLDVTSKIGDDTDGIHAGYLCMGTYNSVTKEIRLYPGVDYEINYNPTTRILDFSGTYNGLPTCVGMVAKNKNTGQWNTSRTYFNIYTNLKLELTSTYSGMPYYGNDSANPTVSGLNGIDISTDANIKIITN